jgi:hypothetical protein
MAEMSENSRRVVERWTLFIGGVEMLIGAALGAFPSIFPSWLAYVAVAIALVTIGVGLMLVWTDISKATSLLHVKPSLVGPLVSGLGLAIILGLGLWYFFQAPKDAFAGSSVGVILTAAILVVLFSLLGPNSRAARNAVPEGGAVKMMMSLHKEVHDIITGFENKLEREIPAANERLESRVSDLNTTTVNLQRESDGALAKAVGNLDAQVAAVHVRIDAATNSLRQESTNLAGKSLCAEGFPRNAPTSARYRPIDAFT